MLSFKYGPGETRTLTPKALDPKSSASTNFATGPLVIFNFQFVLGIVAKESLRFSPLEKRYLIFFLGRVPQAH